MRLFLPDAAEDLVVGGLSWDGGGEGAGDGGDS